jgi:hypothetical protein
MGLCCGRAVAEELLTCAAAERTVQTVLFLGPQFARVSTNIRQELPQVFKIGSKERYI